MRIALVGPTYPFRGGIAHYTTLLYRALKGRHEVKLFAFRRQYPKWLFPGATDRDDSAQPISEPGVVYALDSMNPLTWLSTAWQLARWSPDAVVLPWWVYFWAPQLSTIARLASACARAKIIYLCHNVAAHEDSGLSRLVTRFVLSTGHAYIVHSSEDERNLRAMFARRPIRRSFHPTYEVFRASGLGREQARNELGLSGNVILFFGFVRPYKGLADLVQSLPEVLERIDATVLVVGEFWGDRGEYDALIDRLGVRDHLRIVDAYVPNEEVERYFAAADLVALPYRSATGSGVVQIAYGFEKPVVATVVGCLPEVVQEGRTGYLVPPCNPTALAEAIVRFFQTADRDRMAQAIKDANALFSWDRMVESIEALLLEETHAR